MKRLVLLLAAALLALPAQARKNKAIYIDTSEKRGEPVGMRDPEEELALIIKRIERGELPKIQFEYDSDEILLESYTTLDAIADLLRPDPTLKVMVLAHTCIMGSEKYNLDLSQRRAKSVKTFLVRRGIPPPSIRYRGMGFAMPIADNSTEEGRAKNRRVEFRITYRDWPSVY